MQVQIFRCEPDSHMPERFDTFEVPVPHDDKWTVMDVLDYITLHLDPSVAYYKHSVCDHGICGRCLLRVNGTSKLACTCTVDADAPLLLEPMEKRARVRDLVVK